MPDELNQLVQLVQERLTSVDQRVDEAVSEDRIRGIVQEVFDGYMSNPEFQRKMRFGTDSSPARMIGSKFARYGLTASNIEFLYDIQRSLAGQRMKNQQPHPGPSEELENAFNDVSQAYYVPMDQVRSIDQKALDDLFPRIPLRDFYGRDRQLAARGAWQETEAYRNAVRAMDTAESGYGSQLVDVQYVPELWQASRQVSRIYGLLQQFEMNAPTAYLPIEADIPEMFHVPEVTTNNAANYDTSKVGSQRVQVDAKKFMIHLLYSGEMWEDSMIPLVPFYQMQAMKSMGHYSDSVVLNGDTTTSATGNINSDDQAPGGVITGLKHYLAFDGIRKVGLVDNTNNQANMAGAISYDALINQRGRMVDYTYLMNWGKPTDPEDLIYVADTTTCDAIALLDEVITVDKYGALATVLTGEVAKIGRHPLIDSMAMQRTAADGKIDTATPGNNTKGQVATFNKRGLVVGTRRRVQTETERLPGTDQWRIVLSLRIGLGRYAPSGASSSLEMADVIYNIT